MRTRSLIPAMAGFLAGTLTTSAIAGGGPDPWALIARARAEVRGLDELAFSLRDPEARRALHGRVVRLDGQLVALEQTLSPRAPCAVSDAELAPMLGALRAQPFDDDKLVLLGDMVGRHRFTSQQVATILGTFTFDDDKVEVAARLYPQVVDPQAFWTVYGALTFSSSKDALRARLASTR